MDNYFFVHVVYCMKINANMQNDSLMDDVFTICER